MAFYPGDLVLVLRDIVLTLRPGEAYVDNPSTARLDMDAVCLVVGQADDVFGQELLVLCTQAGCVRLGWQMVGEFRVVGP